MNFSLPAILTFAALTGLASASVVNIDFNHLTSATYSGQAAASDLAGGGTAYWNPLLRTVAGTASSVALQDSTNTATGVGFTLSGLTGSSSTIGEQEVSVGGGFRSLMRDYVSIDAGSTPGAVVTATGKFTGLVVGASYELYFYGQGSILGTVSGVPLNQGQNSLFTVDGTSKQTEWDDVAGGNGSLAENIEYVKFLAVADINGEIDFPSPMWSPASTRRAISPRTVILPVASLPALAP